MQYDSIQASTFQVVQEFEEIVSVPLDSISFLARKDSDHLLRLEQEYGVKVILPTEVIEIRLMGSDPVKLAAARTQILENLPWDQKKPLAEEAKENISQIREEERERLLRNAKEVESAPLNFSAPLPAAVMIPFEKQRYTEIVQEKVILLPDQIGYIAGPAFENKRRLERTYDVSVTIPAKGTGSQILLEGTAENVAAAKADILENIPSQLTMPLDPNFIRFIRGSSAIQNLRDKHEVRIVMKGNFALITGRKKNCDRALTELKLLEAKPKKSVPLN